MTHQDNDRPKTLHDRAREAEREWRKAQGITKTDLHRAGGKARRERPKPMENWQRKRQRDRQERRALRVPMLKGV